MSGEIVLDGQIDLLLKGCQGLNRARDRQVSTKFHVPVNYLCDVSVSDLRGDFREGLHARYLGCVASVL